MFRVGRAPLTAGLPPLLLLVRGYAMPAVSSLDQIEPVSKVDTETLSSCYLSGKEPGIFPKDRLNFTTVCCKTQYHTFRSPSANVCLERALKIRFDIMLRKAQIHPTPPLPVGNGTSRLLSDPDRHRLIKFLT